MSPTAGAGRWLGLDALRGLSIAAMILVNNPGSWATGHQFAPLRHAEWHGCTFTDLVFPTFLFCAGVAIAPALGRHLAEGRPRGPIAAKIGKRVLVLVLLGLMLSAFPFVSPSAEQPLEPLLSTRFPGVLQRIGVCYGAAALLFLFTGAAVQRAVLVGCLLLYWPLITLVPVPGVGPPDIGDPTGTLQGFLDRAVFGDHIWVKGQYDPEGILSTIPALATCLLGVEAGRVLAGGKDDAAKARLLVGQGLLLMAAGYAWSTVLPLNKPLWTSSYAVWTGGIAMVALGVLHRAAMWPGGRLLLHPLQVYGVNALLVFVGSGILGRIVGKLVTVTVDGRTMTLKAWFYESALLPLAEPRVASLMFALLWVAGWYVVLLALFRRGIVWKV